MDLYIDLFFEKYLFIVAIGAVIGVVYLLINSKKSSKDTYVIGGAVGAKVLALILLMIAGPHDHVWIIGAVFGGAIGTYLATEMFPKR